ncbi:MAG: glycosyltransferase family 4 protein [Chloroflexota bacterium]|nr:glycosyltransferase family 4 protein [Chloroflexota bacterium]
MKILLLHDKGTATGGAELQMLALRRRLRERGHDARLLASRATPVPGSHLLADYNCFGTNSRLQVLSQTANPSAYWTLRRVMRAFRPDVVHVRLFLWQLSPLILPLLADVPCLYQTAMYKAICPVGTKTLPDGRPCQDAAGLACWRNRCLTPQSWSVLMLQRRLWQRWHNVFDVTVALSETMKSMLEAWGVAPVEVIYNGVPERPMRTPLAGPPTLGYAGRLVAEKGVDILLQALAQVVRQQPTTQLLLAGQGREQPQLQWLAEQLGIADRVHWLGHLPRETLEQHFDTVWVQVVPSRWAEPFGNVSAEAMMRGTAVVASVVGGQTEIVCDGETGLLVPPGDADALAGALLSVLSRRDVAERMGQAGRARALACFSEVRCVDQFESLYQQLIRCSHPKSMQRFSHGFNPRY